MAEYSFDVVVAGHICLDIIPSFLGKPGEVEFNDLFRPGKLTQMGNIVMSSGGPVSNTGIGLLILGNKVELMGKYGDDPLSRNLEEILAKRGLEKSMVQMPGEQTSYTVVLSPPGIDRMFLHCPGANDTYSAGDLNEDVARQARIFHLGYPPLMKTLYRNDGEQLTEVFRRIKTNCPETMASLDMSLPDPASESGQVNWKKVLENTVPYLDLFLPSAEEMLFMLERERFLDLRDEANRKSSDVLELMAAEDIMRLADKLLDLGGKIINIKSGPRGIYTRTAPREELEKVKGFPKEMLDSWAGRELWHAAFHVDPMGSATGSGDSSIAGYLSGLLRGCEIEEAVKMSNAVGGCNVAAMDALSGLKSWEETKKRVDGGWENKPPRIDDNRWKEIVPARLWAGPRDAKA